MPAADQNVMHVWNACTRISKT